MACNIRNCKISPALCCTNNCAKKTCIEVSKVFDACLQRRMIASTFTVEFSGDPTGATVTSVTNSGTGVISNLVITPIEGSPCYRVRFTLTVPLAIVATKPDGTEITGTASMVIQMDLAMRVPQDALILPEIVAIASIVGTQNSIVGNIVTTNACVSIITKVIADVILVVPSYGYPILPTCLEYTQEACSGIFSTPVFPQ